MGSPTDTATRWMRGNTLPFGRMCSLPPMPTGTIGTPSLTARNAAPANSSPISGPERRVPSGNTATGDPGRERVLERAQRGTVGGAALDLHRTERVEESGAERVLEQVVLGQEPHRARGDEGGERDVEDRPVRRGHDVRAGRRDALLPDDPHPEHDLEHAEHDGARELVEGHANTCSARATISAMTSSAAHVAGVDDHRVGRRRPRAGSRARGSSRPDHARRARRARRRPRPRAPPPLRRADAAPRARRRAR